MECIEVHDKFFEKFAFSHTFSVIFASLSGSDIAMVWYHNNNNNNNNIYYLILRKLTYIHDQIRIANITKRKLYVSVIKIN